MSNVIDFLTYLLNILWIENSVEGRFVLLLVLSVLAMSVYFAQNHTRRYERLETPRLNFAAETLRALQKLDPHNVLPALIKKMSESGRGAAATSLIDDRIKAIKKVRESQAKVNVNALQQLTLAHEASRRGLGFPSFAVGFAMLLGLLGTIVGLTKMVQTIHLTLPTAGAHLTPGGWDESLRNIREVLSSMKSAFSATLAGLVCSIISALMNLRLEKAQARYFEKLERFTLEELLPATAPSVEDETMLEKVSQQLENSFGRLQEIADQNGQTIRELGDAEKALGTIIGGIEGIARGNHQGNVYEVLGQLTRVIDKLSEVNKSVVTLSGAVPEALEVAKRNGETVMTKVNDLYSANRDLQRRVDGSFQAVSNLPETLKRVEKALTDGRRDAPGVRDSQAPPDTITPQTLLVFGVAIVFAIGLLLLLFR